MYGRLNGDRNYSKTTKEFEAKESEARLSKPWVSDATESSADISFPETSADKPATFASEADSYPKTRKESEAKESGATLSKPRVSDATESSADITFPETSADKPDDFATETAS